MYIYESTVNDNIVGLIVLLCAFDLHVVSLEEVASYCLQLSANRRQTGIYNMITLS